MECPYCGEKSTVIDSVYDSFENEYYRKRRCKANKYHIFFTKESEIEFDEHARKHWKQYHRYNSNKKGE